MALRKLWPVLLLISSPILCLATANHQSVRVTGSPVPLPVLERQLRTSASRDSRFAAVPHTSTRNSCEAAREPEPLATPNPLLETLDFSSKTVSPRVSVSFIIGTDGRVHSPLILESAGTSPDRKVLNAVRSWRYRPALCNGVPTEAEGNIEFSIQ